jgi:hypothetical protein
MLVVKMSGQRGGLGAPPLGQRRIAAYAAFNIKQTFPMPGQVQFADPIGNQQFPDMYIIGNSGGYALGQNSIAQCVNAKITAFI